MNNQELHDFNELLNDSNIVLYNGFGSTDAIAVDGYDNTWAYLQLGPTLLTWIDFNPRMDK